MCVYITGSAKPRFVIDRVVERGQEVEPFGGVDVLVELVFYESPLQVLPVDFSGLHYTTTARERKLEGESGMPRKKLSRESEHTERGSFLGEVGYELEGRRCNG